MLPRSNKTHDHMIDMIIKFISIHTSSVIYHIALNLVNPSRFCYTEETNPLLTLIKNSGSLNCVSDCKHITVACSEWFNFWRHRQGQYCVHQKRTILSGSCLENFIQRVAAIVTTHSNKIPCAVLIIHPDLKDDTPLRQMIFCVVLPWNFIETKTLCITIIGGIDVVD